MATTLCILQAILPGMAILGFPFVICSCGGLLVNTKKTENTHHVHKMVKKGTELGQPSSINAMQPNIVFAMKRSVVFDMRPSSERHESALYSHTQLCRLTHDEEVQIRKKCAEMMR